MTRKLDSDRQGPTERRRNNRYRVHFLLACAAIFVSTYAEGAVRRAGAGHPWEAAAVLAPVAAAIWLIAVVPVFFVRYMDEFERQLILESAGAGFVAVMVATLLIYGLSRAGVVHDLDGLKTFWIGFVVFLFTHLVLRTKP
jgi:hypothetical protein